MQLMQKIMGGGSPAADDDSSSVGGGAAAGANATSSTSTASALEAPPAKLTIIENAVFKIDETWGYLLASRGIQYIPESFAHPCFFKGTEEHKQGYTGMRWKWTHENLKKLLDAFEAQMARLGGTPYLCGAAPSVADCLFVTRLQRLPKDYAPLNAAECYETSEAIKAYMDRLQANPIFQTQIGS